MVEEVDFSLIKGKKYKWKETNLALFGSDLEKKIKKASAECEDAWKNAGTKEGLQIWRIVSFKVTHWAKKDYGKFYNGDSYIILHTYKKDPRGDALAWDIHFWIGKYSTQDEYGTAAYKSVELDHFLNDAPVIHREIQSHESKRFRSYFDKGIIIWRGGAETGFHHVERDKYHPRLLHIKGTRNNVMVKEVKRRRKYLNSGDVFILDLGLELYQWNGKESNKDERAKANEFVRSLMADRGGRPKIEVIEEEHVDEAHPFYKNIPSGLFGCKEPKTAEKGGSDADVKKFEKLLFRIHERNDHDLSFKQVAKGFISKGALHPSDVFVLDSGFHVFVWVGKEATTHEKGGGIVIANEYVKKSEHPFFPITRVVQGQYDELFEGSFDDNAEIGSCAEAKDSCVIL